MIKMPSTSVSRSCASRWRRTAVSLLTALGLAVALSGCVIVPWHHGHPHYYGY